MQPTPEPTFYLTRKGALSGPFSLPTLQRLVSAGEIVADDCVREHGARDWVRAADHPVLASELAARAELLAQLEPKPARFAVTLPPTSAPRVPKPGELVAGKYRIDSMLGEGGMGAVLSAENVITRKKVALKWLRPELAGDVDARRRFINEARLASRVSHPNVIDIYDVVEDEGPFLVMEQLEGEPLSALLARKALPRSELMRVLVHAMEGVAAAHAQGVVHRDLKPDNIFVCTDASGRPMQSKVLDFGISKAATALREDSAMTAIGVLLGTPYYVPPEQLGHARHVDHRADVYALGVILYECLCRRLPYESPDLATLLRMIHAGGAPSPRVHDDSIPEPLAAIALKAIAPRPDDRFASVEALQLALSPFMDEARASLPQSQPPSPQRASSGSERPSLEPTMTYARRPPRKPRAVIAAAVGGTVLGLSMLVAALRLGSAEEPGPITRSVTQAGSSPSAEAPSPAPVPSVAVAPPAPPAVAAPLAAVPAAAPPAAAPLADSAAAEKPAAAAASDASLALAELRRAARHCGQGEPSASVELSIDTAGRLSALQARGLAMDTAACLERAARTLWFGETPAPRVLSLVLALRPLRSGAPAASSAAPAPPAAPQSAAASEASPDKLRTGAPPPMVNPYHR